jgi:predicted ribosomally synthesized peptide with nif11-like leader
MSVEQAEVFIEKMKSDDELKRRVLSIDDVGERIAYITSLGYSCTEAEIRQVQGLLTDEELSGAAGGCYCLSAYTEKEVV